MVDVPVDYRNPVGCDVGRSVSSERSLRCERDVVEVTESVCAIGLGVVAAGATQRMGSASCPSSFDPSSACPAAAMAALAETRAASYVCSFNPVVVSSMRPPPSAQNSTSQSR